MYEDRRPSGCGNIRLLLGLAIAGASVCAYLTNTQVNPVTGEKQRVAMDPKQEIALGLQSAPQVAQQFGGLDPDPRAQALVDQIGNRVVSQSDAAKSPYKFDFHALADSKTVNAFALPGGQIFVTRALLSKMKSKGELAGVLGHEIGHVVGRHGAEHLAKQQLTQGIVTGVAVGSERGGMTNAMLAAAVGQMINLRYGRDDEIESDRLGLKYMSQAGYDPRSMIRVMQVLKDASGGSSRPEFASSHPDPGRRGEVIKAEIQKMFPNGVPNDLEP